MNEISFESLETPPTNSPEPQHVSQDPEAKRMLRELFMYATLEAISILAFVFLYINTFRISEDLNHTISVSLMPALIVMFAFSQWKFFGVVKQIDKRNHPGNETNQRMMTLGFILHTAFFTFGSLYIYFVQVLRVLN